MRLKPIDVERVIHPGQGAECALYLGDAVALMPTLLEQYAGQVQTIYLDPPYMTGRKFVMRMRVGEKDWRGAPSLSLAAYADDQSEDDYLAMMRQVLTGARALLRDSGMIFLHIDARTHARLRLMMDELFGASNFLNEIIWSYQTGGRSRRYFSRKHDVILFYRKGAKYAFDISAVGVVKPEGRTNHMKKHIDTDGRVYRSIRSGGKIYTYYDDEPVSPGDVWDDVSHLQQKDPQRTGYDTQKPVRLLDRIIQCSSKPGDLVMDLFAGSGTTLFSAHALGRRSVGVDASLLARHVMWRRMADAPVTLLEPPPSGSPSVTARAMVGVGYYEVMLEEYQLEGGLLARTLTGLDALDNWAVGYVKEGGAFHQMACERRSADAPALTGHLKLPVLTGTPAIMTGDVLGRMYVWALDKDGIEYS